MEVESIAIGIDVLVTSSMSGQGYESIKNYITKEKTVAFIGSSGVGKSTLINKLMEEEVLLTNGLRNDDKGRHTTTHRELLALPQGGGSYRYSRYEGASAYYRRRWRSLFQI